MTENSALATLSRVDAERLLTIEEVDRLHALVAATDIGEWAAAIVRDEICEAERRRRERRAN